MAVQKNDPNEQLDLSFPDPEDFPSYDEVDSTQGQAELPHDSYDPQAVGDCEPGEEGCCVR